MTVTLFGICFVICRSVSVRQDHPCHNALGSSVPGANHWLYSSQGYVSFSNRRFSLVSEAPNCLVESLIRTVLRRLRAAYAYPKTTVRLSFQVVAYMYMLKFNIGYNLPQSISHATTYNLDNSNIYRTNAAIQNACSSPQSDWRRNVSPLPLSPASPPQCNASGGTSHSSSSIAPNAASG
jgi:hypothetical protein